MLTRQLPCDHPAFAGHFPGQPVLPGVLLLAEVLEAVLADAAWARLVGTQPVLTSSKFLAAVKPDKNTPIVLAIELQQHAGGLRFEVMHGGVTVARGQFALAVPA